MYNPPSYLCLSTYSNLPIYILNLLEGAYTRTCLGTLHYKSTTLPMIKNNKCNVATLALARDQGKGVVRLRAYK
jgi:hypothetical protein